MAVLDSRMGFSPDLRFHLVSVPSTGGCTGTWRGKSSVDAAFRGSAIFLSDGAPACHHLVRRGWAPGAVAPCWCDLSTSSTKDLNISMDPRQYPLLSTRSLAIHALMDILGIVHASYVLCMCSKHFNLTGFAGTAHFPSPCRNQTGTHGHCMPCGTNLM